MCCLLREGVLGIFEGDICTGCKVKWERNGFGGGEWGVGVRLIDG